MEELFEKLSFLRKKWVKRSLAIFMCIVVTFATMPTSASTAVAYNARVLRDYRVSGVEDIALQETKLLENEAKDENEIPVVESVVVDENDNKETIKEIVVEETTIKSEEENLTGVENVTNKESVSEKMTEEPEVVKTQIEDVSEEATIESETKESQTESETEEKETRDTEEITAEEEAVTEEETLTEEETTEEEVVTEEETLTEEETTEEEAVTEEETLTEEETTEEEAVTEEETTEEEVITEEETLTEEETSEEETLTEEETSEEETLTEEEETSEEETLTEEETTEEETLTEEETTEDATEGEEIEVSVVIEGVSDESKDAVSIQFKNTEDNSVITDNDNGIYTLIAGQEYEILLEGLANCKVVSVNGEAIEDQSFIYQGEETLTIEVKRSFMMFLMNLSVPNPVDVTVMINGTENIDMTQVSFEFTNTETAEVITKNEDGTYTLQPEDTYAISNIEGLDDYQLLEINGTTVNGEYTFTFGGEEELTLTFLNMVMTLSTQIDVTVDGPSDGNFSTLVDSIEFSFKDSNENEVSFQTSSGNAQIELEEDKTYQLSHSNVQGYYISQLNNTSVSAGEEISFTNDGTVTTINITFSAVPKMYHVSNGDYSLDVNKVYELYTYHDIVTGGDVAYNDGGLHTLYFNSADKLMNFVESTEDADENYLVLNGAQIGLNLTNASSQYMMKAVYSASVNGTSANITTGTYGGTLSTVGTASSTIYAEQSYRKMLSAGSNYAIGGTGSVAIRDVILYQVENKALTGYLNNNGSTVPTGMSVIYKNTEYGITKTANVNTDGSYEITLPTTTEGIIYDVTLEAGTTGVQMMETTNSVTVSRNSTDAGEFEVESSGEVTFVFSSTDTGFADVKDDITTLNVTLNRTTTTVVPDASGVFKTTLTAGKMYSFEVEGVPAYEVTGIKVDGNTTTGNSYTYIGTEQEIELVFGLRELQKVYFDILDEDKAILEAKSIDFTNADEFTFTFTNGNNIVIPTVQKESSGEERYYVELCAGTYTVELSGTGIHKIPYEMTSSTVAVTVEDDGEEKFYFDMEEITAWTFSTAGGFDDSCHFNKGTTGYWKGLYVDATAEKFVSNSGKQAQMNAGAIVSVPVSGPSTITIATYSVDNANAISLVANQTDVEKVAESSNAVIYYMGTSAGEVQFTTDTNSTYVLSLKVTEGVPSSDEEITTWYFNGTEEEGAATFTGVYNGSSGEWKGLFIDATSGGKLDYREGSNDSQMNKGTRIKIPVKSACTINVKSYSGLIQLSEIAADGSMGTTGVTSTGDASIVEGKEAVITYSGTGEGAVAIVATANDYLHKIEIVYPSDEVYTEWNFKDYGDGEEYFTGQYQGTSNGTGTWRQLQIDATNGKLSGNTSNTQMGANTYITIPVLGACTIIVTAHDSGYAQKIEAGDSQTDVTVSYNSNTAIVEYTGTGNTVTIKSTAETYLWRIEIEDSSSGDTGDTGAEDSELPRIAKDSELYGSSLSALTETIEGQRITVTQSGGPEVVGIAKGNTSFTGMGYYIFEATTGYDTLSFDMKITQKGSSSKYGVFPGIFTAENMYTAGFRGDTRVQKIYSDSSTYTKNSGTDETAFALDERFHIEIARTADTKCTISVSSYTDNTHKATYTCDMLDASGTNMYYGLAITQATVEISNLLYTSKSSASDTGSVTYNQNDVYEPVGTVPTARALYATATELNGGVVVELSILGDTPTGDAFYIIQRSENNGSTWETIVDPLYDTTYIDDSLTPGVAGTYIYQVIGQLGRPNRGGTQSSNGWIQSKSVTVNGALSQPVVTATGSETGITLSWTCEGNPDYYTIYRYSYDDGFDNKTIIRRKETGTTYTDTVAGGLVQDDPYFYIVQAVVETPSYNESLITEEAAVWAVPASNRTGYDYEAVNIVITNRSYQTVYTSDIMIEGLVDGKGGTIAAYVNDTKKAELEVDARETFTFELTVSAGRNNVDLIFTAADGTQAKKTFSYIYVSDFDAIVDAAYTGTDGEASTIVSGGSVPTYSTIQAALDAAPSGSDRHVILILEGDYEERLVIEKPNITLLGEEPERTILHNYPGNVGGDTSLRCAFYIKSTATNFSAENLTFTNDYEYGSLNQSNESADAVRCDANGTTFVNCIFNGMQDTLLLGDGRQYYDRCQINGLVDYIYCNDYAKALFNECILTFIGHSKKASGYVTAPKTAIDNEYGLVFNQCAVVSNSNCGGNDYRLSRPWGADGMTVWINCFLGNVINEAEPYDDMSGNQPEDARFWEYYSYGPSYLINDARTQISKKHANELISEGILSFKDTFVGSLKITRDKLYLETVFESDTYAWGTSENEDAMADYFLEGYGESYGISGGGLLKETSDNYYQVGTAEEFLQALTQINTKKAASVIELTADIALGSNELGSLMNTYSTIIKPYANQPLTHPTLKQTGVSVLTLNKLSNITIFSHNGFTIKHANIHMKQCTNIMIRNIRFDELWEWDEATSGAYDRNDWDYMTIEKSDGIWIDHCSFYKAYDGIVDIKNPNPTSNVTISWCNFFPGSKDGTFLQTMMDYVRANPSEFPTTYQVMLASGMTEDQIDAYAYAQKKTSLFGQSDSATNASGIKVTMANNYFAQSMDRLPRLRYGTAHIYNTIMDSQSTLDAKDSVTDSAMKSKFVSNGASSTCGAQMLLENTLIQGIMNPLNSGNGSSPAGYINAINSAYYMYKTRATLEVKNNTSADDQVLITNATSFRQGLPYTYSLKNAINLYSTVQPYSGAGKVTMTTLQWEQASYNTTKKASESSSITDAPESSEDIPDVKDYEDIKDEEANAGLEEVPEEEVVQEEEKSDDTNDSNNTDNTKQEPVKEEEPEEEKPVAKLGDTILVNGRAYIVASINGDIAYRVSSALPEDVLTAEVRRATGTNSIVDLINFLKNDLANTTAMQVNQMVMRSTDSMQVVDISVVILQPNGEWVEATKETFPSSGLNVVIPYPSRTSRTTHRFAVSHLIVLGCNGKTPGTIEYLIPTCVENGLQVHIMDASPFTIVWELLVAPTTPETKVEESAGSKWISAMKANSSVSAEEDAESRARNGSMSTRFTIDSVMGSGYLLWVSFVSVAIMGSGNYLYYRKKRKEELEEEAEHVMA